jgi:ABC-type uncharacterized transport system permease subunit
MVLFILQATILAMIPLMIVALAGAFSEHSGIINLGLEGEMIFGAFIGCIFCRAMINSSGSPPLPSGSICWGCWSVPRQARSSPCSCLFLPSR